MKTILFALFFFISQVAFAENAGTQFIASLKALETMDWNVVKTSMQDAYADNVEFNDPLFHKHNLAELMALYKEMLEGAKEIHVSVIQENVPEVPNELDFDVTLEYTLKLGVKITIKDAKVHIKFNNEDKIFDRKDTWGLLNLRISFPNCPPSSDGITQCSNLIRG